MIRKTQRGNYRKRKRERESEGKMSEWENGKNRVTGRVRDN